MGQESGHGAVRIQAQHLAPVGFHFHFGCIMECVILGRISISSSPPLHAVSGLPPPGILPHSLLLPLHCFYTGWSTHQLTLLLHAPTFTQPPSHHLSVPFSLPSPAQGGGTEPPCHCHRGTGRCAALPLVPMQGCLELGHQMDPAPVLWPCAPLPKWNRPGADGGI